MGKLVKHEWLVMHDGDGVFRAVPCTRLDTRGGLPYVVVRGETRAKVVGKEFYFTDEQAALADVARRNGVSK